MGMLSVSDIISLPEMSNHKILAGERGIKNVVTNQVIMDNKLTEEDYPKVSNLDGAMIFTSFFYGQHEPEYITKTVKFYTESKVSAIVVISGFIYTAPDEAKMLCEVNDIPLIFLNQFIPYSEILTKVDTLKKSSRDTAEVGRIIQIITDPATSRDTAESMIRDLNVNLVESCVVFFACGCEESSDVEVVKRKYAKLVEKASNSGTSVVSDYNGGLIIIHSVMNNEVDRADRIIDKFIDVEVDKTIKHASLGVSEVVAISDLGKAIKQAYMSAKSGAVGETEIVRFGKLGTFRLLVALQDNQELKEFYNATIEPILEYDKRSKADLFKTCISYADHDMSYPKTAEAMDLHINTIRYRIEKVLSIVNYGTKESEFIELLSLINKLYKIYTLY